MNYMKKEKRNDSTVYFLLYQESFLGIFEIFNPVMNIDKVNITSVNFINISLFIIPTNKSKP